MRVIRRRKVVAGASLFLAFAMAGCGLLMVPAYHLQIGKDETRDRVAREAFSELSIGNPPPGGMDAWLKRKEGVAVLSIDSKGRRLLVFPHSLCSTEAQLEGDTVTAFTGCVERCTDNARPVDCSWLRGIVTPG